jgi:hypothetical protein
MKNTLGTNEVVAAAKTTLAVANQSARRVQIAVRDLNFGISIETSCLALFSTPHHLDNCQRFSHYSLTLYTSVSP